MKKLINWFKTNIFQVHYFDDECFGIHLFKTWIDFRYFYQFDDDRDTKIWYLSNEVEDIINGIKKKNKFRKNKLLIPTYSQIPIYNSIINWSDLLHRSGKLRWSIVAFIFGFILKGFI